MKIKCPHCGQEYEVGEEFAGQQADCTSCNNPFPIPARKSGLRIKTPEQTGQNSSAPPSRHTPPAPPPPAPSSYTRNASENDDNSGVKKTLSFVLGGIALLLAIGIAIVYSSPSMEDSRPLMPWVKPDISDLFDAIDENDLRSVKILVRRGADVNQGTKKVNGMPPLVRAASNGNIEMVRFFVKNGAQINIVHKYKENDGITYQRTALSFATFKEHEEIVKFLLSLGADTEIKNHGGITAIHISALGLMQKHT